MTRTNGHQPPPQVPHLSQRQAQIVVLTAKSLTKDQIRETLGISKGTLECHLGVIAQKLGTNTRQELTMLAVAMGWIDNPYGRKSVTVDAPPDV